MKVTVVIPARDSAATLNAQLRALSVQSYSEEFEIIVADNGSTDRTADVAREWQSRFPNLVILDAGRSAGTAVARNEAARVARGELLLFCDADDEIDPRWIEEIVAGLVQYDVAGGLLSLDELNSPRTRGWRTDADFAGLPVAMGFLPYAVGANFAVRAAVYEELGGCDERYVGGHDDVEFCWRAQLAGYSLGFVSTAIVNYRLRSSLRTLARQRFRYGWTYAQLFAQFEHMGIAGGSLRKEARRWAWLVLRSCELLDRRAAGRWLFSAAWHFGRLRGSHVYGVLCPD